MYLADHVVVMRLVLHAARLALHVHQAHRHAERGHRIQCTIAAQRIHIIDHASAGSDRGTHHLGSRGIDGDRQ